jgi:hypothetical protein
LPDDGGHVLVAQIGARYSRAQAAGAAGGENPLAGRRPGTTWAVSSNTLLAPLAIMGAGETLGHGLAGEHPAIAEQALQEHVSTGGSTTRSAYRGRALQVSRHYTVGISPETAQAHPTAPTPEQYSQFGERSQTWRPMNFAPFENAPEISE